MPPKQRKTAIPGKLTELEANLDFTSPNIATQLHPGQRVQVFDQGKWYAATVLLCKSRINLAKLARTLKENENEFDFPKDLQVKVKQMFIAQNIKVQYVGFSSSYNGYRGMHEIRFFKEDQAGFSEAFRYEMRRREVPDYKIGFAEGLTSNLHGA